MVNGLTARPTSIATAARWMRGRLFSIDTSTAQATPVSWYSLQATPAACPRGRLWRQVPVRSCSSIRKRRDVRAVEGARLENEAGQRHRATSNRVNAYAISDLTLSNSTPRAFVNLDVCRGFKPHVSHSYHNPLCHFRAHTPTNINEHWAIYASVLTTVDLPLRGEQRSSETIAAAAEKVGKEQQRAERKEKARCTVTARI